MNNPASLPNSKEVKDPLTDSSVVSAMSSTVQYGPGTTIPSKLGRYQLESLLGRGGFCEVWRGYDSELERSVAIKVFRPDRVLSNDVINSLLTEGQKLAKITHPSVVAVFDAGCDDGRFFMVTALVEGSSLSDLLNKKAGFSAISAASIVAEMARAVHAAHLRGIVHRDIKPANILINEAGKPFLADFGIATTEEESISESAGVVGTIAYMSPEQLMGASNRVDSRSDVYSLGVVLYHLLTGRLPYVAHDLEQCREQILNREPRPPRTIDDQIPQRLEEICLKCLSKSFDERYTTALDLANALSAWERSTQVKPWSARNPLLFGAAGVLLTTAMIWGGLMFSGRRQPNAETPRPESAGDVRPPAEWQILPLDSLQDLIPATQGRARYIDSSGVVLLDSLDKSSAWVIGETDATEYELEVEFEFLQTGIPDPNRYRFGVFVGGSSAAGDGRHWQMQLWELTAGQKGHPATLSRMHGTVTVNSEEELTIGNSPIVEQAVDLSMSQSHRLFLSVGREGIREVIWDDTPLSHLSSSQSNSFFVRSLYEGKIGMVIENSEIVLKQIRIRNLSQRSNS